MLSRIHIRCNTHLVQYFHFLHNFFNFFNFLTLTFLLFLNIFYLMTEIESYFFNLSISAID